MDGCKIFRRGRQGRRGGGVALYFTVYFDGVELEAQNDYFESLWVRIRGRTNNTDILVGTVIDCLTRMKRQMRHSTSL